MYAFESLPLPTLLARWVTGGRLYVVDPAQDAARWVQGAIDAGRTCVVVAPSELDALLWAAALGKPLLRPDRKEEVRLRATAAASVVVAADHMGVAVVRRALEATKVGACWLVVRADRLQPGHPEALDRAASVARAFEALRGKGWASLGVDVHLAPGDAVTVAASVVDGSVSTTLNLPVTAQAVAGGSFDDQDLLRVDGTRTIRQWVGSRLSPPDWESLEHNVRRGVAGIDRVHGVTAASVPGAQVILDSFVDLSDMAPLGTVTRLGGSTDHRVGSALSLADSVISRGAGTQLWRAVDRRTSPAEWSALVGAGLVHSVREVRSRAVVADAQRFRAPFVDRWPSAADLHRRWQSAKKDAPLAQAAMFTWVDPKGKDLGPLAAVLGLSVAELGERLAELDQLGLMTVTLEQSGPGGDWEIDASLPTDDGPTIDELLARVRAIEEGYAGRRRAAVEAFEGAACFRTTVGALLGHTLPACGRCSHCQAGSGVETKRPLPEAQAADFAGRWPRWVEAVEAALVRWSTSPPAQPFHVPEPPAGATGAGFALVRQALAGADGARRDLVGSGAPGADVVALALDLQLHLADLAHRGAARLDVRGTLPAWRDLPLDQRAELRALLGHSPAVPLRPRAILRWMDWSAAEGRPIDDVERWLPERLLAEDRPAALALLERLAASPSRGSERRLWTMLADIGALPPEALGPAVEDALARGREAEAVSLLAAAFEHHPLDHARWCAALPSANHDLHLRLASALDAREGGTRFSDNVDDVLEAARAASRIRRTVLDAAGRGELGSALATWWGHNPLSGRGPLGPEASEAATLRVVRSAMVDALVGRFGSVFAGLARGVAPEGEVFASAAADGLLAPLVAALRSVVRARPNDAPARLALARALDRYRPGAEARMHWEQAIALVSEDRQRREFTREAAEHARAAGAEEWAARMERRHGA